MSYGLEDINSDGDQDTTDKVSFESAGFAGIEKIIIIPPTRLKILKLCLVAYFQAKQR